MYKIYRIWPNAIDFLIVYKVFSKTLNNRICLKLKEPNQKEGISVVDRKSKQKCQEKQSSNLKMGQFLKEFSKMVK